MYTKLRDEMWWASWPCVLSCLVEAQSSLNTFLSLPPSKTWPDVKLETNHSSPSIDRTQRLHTEVHRQSTTPTGEANFGKVKWPKNKRKLILHPRCLRCYVAKFREECGSWKGERPWVTHYTSKHICIQRSESIKKQFFKHHCRHLTLPRSFLV